jgi:hypothetical protein
MAMQQSLLLLRMPPELAKRCREMIKEGQELEFAEQVGSATASATLEKMMLDIRPQGTDNADGDKFVFTFEGQEYPALLSNMATQIEIGKTFDQKTTVKSGDVGQMLQVFRSEKARVKAKNKQRKNGSGLYVPPGVEPSPLDNLMPSGISPPTKSITRRRFEMTRTKKAPPPEQVQEVVEDMNRTWKIKTLDDKELYYIEYVEEDLVDFEEWMVDEDGPGGLRVVTLGHKKDCWEEDAQLVKEHPDAFYKKTDLRKLLETLDPKNSGDAGAAPQPPSSFSSSTATLGMDSAGAGANSSLVDLSAMAAGEQEQGEGEEGDEDEEEDEREDEGDKSVDEDDDWMVGSDEDEENDEDDEAEGEGTKEEVGEM